MTVRDAATQAQVDAANPATSTWLAANAGSGKTRVLTDRVARLLFDEVEPQNILCLTYTKAAASEMQNRLFKRLGEWAMMPAPALRGQLLDLGVEGDLTAERLRRARTLFARAIETPGGLRIQTIHSFCAGLLRRFPLEAGVSPQFSEMEDRAAELLRDEVTEAISIAQPHLMAELASHLTSDDFAPLLLAIAQKRDRFRHPADEAALRTVLGLDPGATLDGLIATLDTPQVRALIGALIPLCTSGSVMDQKAAARLSGPASRPAWSMQDIATMETVFLTGAGAKSPFSAKTGSFPTKDTRASAPDLIESLDDLMVDVEHLRPTRLALQALDRTLALHAFAAAFIRQYDAAKLARGVLDYDDLILKARALLTDPRVAQWVLFRLDGGIDHILVDEAQDTSPAQWDVIRSLAQEFTAGLGARADKPRTIFVVGDKKQSIYSFQGADPEGFDRMRDHFRGALDAIDAPFQARDLRHSFRSAYDILRVVDLTFQNTALQGLGPDPLSHIAFHEALPGRVDLWPPLEAPDKEDDLPWTEPVDQVSSQNARVQLARDIAAQIRHMIAHDTLPVVGQGGIIARRRITAGDVLILVRGRGKDSTVSLFEEIISACKAAALDVAGADVVQLGAELAVRDILALLRFLALPEDDLSLAAALRSPLLGWTEQQLYALAQPRGTSYLWQALRDTGAHPETAAILDDLRGKAEFLRPYDLINRILTRHDGRRRLIARLGQECEDGMDALLSQALAYERAEIPGLTGFVEWLGAGELEIKRQVGGRGGKIRVMTVHGAKGLESPIVILPDTAKRNPPVRARIYDLDGHAVWPPAADDMPPTLQAVKDRLKDADTRESRRLLYVAMTRAESWLIVCAAGAAGTGDDSWHAMVQTGLAQTGGTDCLFPTGPGTRVSTLDWDAGEVASETAIDAEPVSVFAELGPAEPPSRAARTLSPSDLGGAKALPEEAADGNADDAMARGTLVHLLLQHLPDQPPDQRAALGRAILAAAPEAAGLPGASDVLADVLRLIDAPGLGPIFSPAALTEVDVTAQLPLGRLHGAIDRLIVTPDRILAIDYKSNRLVPETADRVPEGLLRQMGAYHAMLHLIWPDRQIDVAILWTATATLMPLPAPQVTAAYARATLP